MHHKVVYKLENYLLFHNIYWGYKVHMRLIGTYGLMPDNRVMKLSNLFDYLEYTAYLIIFSKNHKILIPIYPENISQILLQNSKLLSLFIASFSQGNTITKWYLPLVAQWQSAGVPAQGPRFESWGYRSESASTRGKTHLAAAYIHDLVL